MLTCICFKKILNFVSKIEMLNFVSTKEKFNFVSVKLYFRKMSLGAFFGLDKLQKLARMVKNHGGVKASLYHLYLTDDLKV